MPNLPKYKLLLSGLVLLVIIIFSVWLISSYTYFQNGQLVFGHVVARVDDKVLSDADFNLYKPVYIGQKQCTSSSKVTASYQEVVDYLVKVTKEKDEATAKNLLPTKAEIDNEMIDESLQYNGSANLLKKCGWTDAEFTRAVEVKLIEKKLGVS